MYTMFSAFGRGSIWCCARVGFMVLFLNIGGVLTQSDLQINIRLVNGSDASRGRLEIQKVGGDGVWGTVCNDQYEVDNKAATVVCRQLGYLWGEAALAGEFGFGTTDQPIFLDQVMCEGTEASIANCRHDDWDIHNCFHHEDVGAICHNTSVRLRASTRKVGVGVVEVMGEYRWRDACDTGWNNWAATLVCKELGFVHGVAECCSALGPYPFLNVNNNEAKSYNYNCAGTETRLADCPNTTFSRMCEYSHRASVVCHDTAPDKVNMSFALRMTTGGENWGKVEVRHSGVWGQVCNDKWTDTAANVTCQQLGQGFIGGVALGSVNSIAWANVIMDMPVWLVDPVCIGTEKSLDKCVYTQWGEPLVSGCLPAYVLCYKKTGVQVDIVGGEKPHFGRVQITYDGVPGSVCTEEWSDNDASLVCRMKNYSDGVVRTPSGSQNVPPYYLNRLMCFNSPKTLFMCTSYGWGVNTETCTQAAHVMCYKNIRLAGGTEKSGVVLYYDESTSKWMGFCDLGFKQDYADMICRELGHETGTLLEMGAYGKKYIPLGRTSMACVGNETSVLDCPYDKQTVCWQTQKHYVSVSCHKDVMDKGPMYRLMGNVPDAKYGKVEVLYKHTWGEICADGWTDREAHVFCITEGYAGGVADSYATQAELPTLVSEVKCQANETNFISCVIGDYFFCETKSRAGVICYTDSAPTVSLVGGGLNYGRVQVSSDGVAGSVCDWEWESKAADVVCRQINSNFTQGEVYYDFPPATGEVMLRVQSCSGIEKSLLKCANDGWRNIPQACLDHSHDVGVYCYGKVRVVSGTKTHSVVTGRVEVRPPPDSGDGRDWIAVCGEGFDQQDAEVVCREMGFDRAKVLAPGSFGVKPLWKFYTNMTCKPGGLDIHSDCTYDKGVCKSSTHNYASVMCYKSGTDPHQKFYIENGFHGLVIVEEYGLNGTVCVDGWSDRDATVLCRSKGYKAGVVLGVPEIFTRTMPIWYTNVSCTGREGTLADCSKADNVPIICSMSLKAAGVLCYKTTGVSVHLANSQGANYYGRVEVEVDGVRGTICDYDWSTYDARVTCGQLGFVDGEAFRKSFYGNGNGSIVLSGMTCDSMERSLLECPSMGWNNIHVICNGHNSDAGVFCKRKVMTDQAENYGAVKVWNKGSYYLVCAEGFDDVDALVVCRTMGYTFGKSLCCDAFGQQSAKLGFSSSMCTGQEVNYEDCPKAEGQGACPSNQYASVVCSREAALPGFEISIEEYDYVSGSGPLLIEMQGQKGYMCAEDFDDKDATVACRQLGYIGGYAYKYYNEDVKSRSTLDLRWLRGPNCTGLEARLDECPGINIANVSGCFVLSHAAVFCYKDSVLSDFEVRLSSAPHPGEGFVQVKVNNTWGSICTYDTLISDFEATVVCQQLHFKYGVNIPIPSYPRVTGKVWLNNLNCVGKEHSVQECLLSGMGQRVSPVCQSHSHDMAVKCYAHVRLAASITPNFGMVQVLNETGNHWVAVCDTGFDDTAATVVCRNIGYKAGKAQCCSSMGSRISFYNPIEVSDVKCPENETDFTKCSYNMSKNVVCPSGNYVSVLCTDNAPPKEDLHASIVSRGHFGNVEVSRYGVQGALCDLDWDDNDAMVLCRELNYTHGFATNGTNTAEKPILLTGVDCYGNETSISQCRYPPLILGHGCSNRLTRAAAFCSLNSEPIQYRVANLRNKRGRAEIYVNGMWGTICDLYWEDRDANVFCRQMGYLGGEATVLVSSGHNDQPIWMSHVECTGKETNFMQCRARWDGKAVSRCSHYDDAGVKCYRSARLKRGDYATKQTNGIVEILGEQHRYANSWYTVCADTFTDKEAEVVCRVLGHDHGMAVCCSPYGYNTSPMTTIRPKCNGTEKQFTDCELVSNNTECARQNYASVTCYNGSRTQTEYSVALKGSLKYTGQVVLTYMGVPGRICRTGWSDEDARVICREIGFKNGSAYYHYKSTFIYLDYNGPYWTSNVECLGNETQLSDCPHIGFGYVTDCNDRGHYAGVICFDDVDVAYRISGADSRYGRVEFTYDGTWHTICSSTWGQPEANVTCRQLGYVTGDTYNGDYSVAPSGKAYTVNFRCTGEEDDLGDCPHEGIQESMFCQDHKQDEGVFCYTSVKLSGSPSYKSGNGTVLYYLNDSWSFVCNDGFTDVSAKRVCQELGFADGRSICCAAFGTVVMIDRELSNYSLQCKNADTPIEDCLVKLDKCTSGYASVVCFKEGQVIEDDKHTFELEKASEGQIMVTHYGVTGRICSRDWDDNEAKVFCRGRGFKNGIAYQRSESNVLLEKRGPYWLGGFNCTGNESSIMDCPHLNRTNLENCTSYDIAAVLCYNDSGIQYRLADGSNHYGRVEIQIGGRWGTVCDQYWDRREASVICRQLNFTDGEAVGGAHFGRGKGPIWISHLECKGTEAMLHQCPHRGFTSEFSFDWWFPLPCETHSDDAGVFCYQSVRLNRGPSAGAGGLEVHRNGVWYGVCDTGFTRKEALVVCKSLKSHYVDALALGGSAYGNLTGQVGFSRIKCNGSETDLTHCDMTFDPVCPTGHYASVYCSNKTIVDNGFSVRLAGDSLSSRVHGILEARVQGIWGRVCLYGFDDKAASVVCRQFGYDGGVAYLHIMKNDKPVLVRDIRCNGTENSLTDCTMKQMSPDLDHCHYGSNDAGVICYNNTGGTGFDYRLNGGSDPSNGRVEIGYGGRWGMVCAWSWQTADASVLCRALGYKDGIVSYDKNKSLGFSIPWVTGFFCTGNEASPMTCLNTGFNSTFLTDLCMGGRDIGALSQCYREHVVPKDIRLVDGPNNHTGRVEVFVTGANEWGTICDDYWDDMDARVVCSQLGLYGGTALKKAPFGPGTGRIWFDNMKCKGNESTIFNCSHRGLGTHNCNHTEDVGVICQVAPPPTSAPVTTTTLATTAPPVKTTPKKTTTVAPIKPSRTTSPRPPSTQPPTTRQTRPPITTPAPTPRPTTTTTKAPVTAPPATTMKQETTPKAETTPKPTIQTTTDSPKEQTTHSKISPVTKEQTTRRINVTVSSAQSSSSRANIGVIVAVPLVIIFVIAIIVAFVVIRFRRQKAPVYREHFDDSVISRHHDGTVTANNQLYDLNLQPTSPGSMFSSPDEDNMILGANGSAHYSKGVSDGENKGAFSNPLYDANKDFDSPIEGQVNGVPKSLPANGEITFPENDILGNKSNA